ncbi:MAG: hypothetical protein AAF035_00045 [Pseudomonadota bacterium]
MKALIAIGALGLGAAGLFGVGGTMFSGGDTPEVSAKGAPFVKACLKSTEVVNDWAKEEMAKKREKVAFNPTVAVNRALRAACVCGVEGLKDGLSESDRTRAGQTYGTLLAFQMGGFRRYAEKTRSKRKVKRALKANKRRERELKRWMVVKDRRVQICLR